MAREPFTTTIDGKIKEDFKKTCDENNENMNDILEAFMLDYIQGKFEITKEVKVSLKRIKK